MGVTLSRKNQQLLQDAIDIQIASWTEMVQVAIFVMHMIFNNTITLFSAQIVFVIYWNAKRHNHLIYMVYLAQAQSIMLFILETDPYLFWLGHCRFELQVKANGYM